MDVYSAAVVLFELVMGWRPFRGDTLMAVLKQHEAAPRRQPTDMPDRLWATLREALSAEPNRRPGAAELAAQLDQVGVEVSGLPAAGRTEPPPPEPIATGSQRLTEGVDVPSPAPSPRAKRVLVGAVAAVVMAVVLTSSGALLGQDRGDDSSAGLAQAAILGRPDAALSPTQSTPPQTRLPSPAAVPTASSVPEVSVAPPVRPGPAPVQEDPPVVPEKTAPAPDVAAPSEPDATGQPTQPRSRPTTEAAAPRPDRSSTSRAPAPRSQPSTSRTKAPRPGPSTSRTKAPRPGPSTSRTKAPRPGPSTSRPTAPRPQPTQPLSGDQVVKRVLSASNPSQAYARLGSREKALFGQHMFVHRVRVGRATTEVAPAPGRTCWWAYATATAYSQVETRLFDYKVRGRWCVKDGEVVGKQGHEAGATAYAQGWRRVAMRPASQRLSADRVTLKGRHTFSLAGVQSAEQCLLISVGAAGPSTAAAARC